jgi:spermidine synthase
VLEIGADAVDTAEELLKTLGAQEVVVVDLDTNVADLFAGEQEPTAEPEPAATPAA